MYYYCEREYGRGVTRKVESEAKIETYNFTRVSNSTRLWPNNGHTPNEMFNLLEQDKLLPLPLGRPNRGK